MQNVFIIGSKGIPAAYGGYETFVDKLTEYHRNNDKIKYHVACKTACYLYISVSYWTIYKALCKKNT